MSPRSGPNAPGIAFITGGARGLGNAIAVSFAKEGARGVVIVDIQDEPTFKAGRAAVEAEGAKCLAIHADVTKEEDVERAVKRAVEEFGRIDYAANFAGVLGSGDRISELSLEDYERTMGVNATGVFLATKWELKQMMGQDASPGVEENRIPQRGSIINCASVNSRQATQGVVAYTASKHAVIGITKTAALEAREHSIRVNAVSPGFLLTKLVENVVTDRSTGEKLDFGEKAEARQGRAATFDEVGDVVVLLSLPRMSLVNGVNLAVDGGFTINEGTA